MGQLSLHMATDYSDYEDIAVTGKIVKVCSRGVLIIEGDQCYAEKGRVRYLHRKLRFIRSSPDLDICFDDIQQIILYLHRRSKIPSLR
jgi:hypothetical protein